MTDQNLPHRPVWFQNAGEMDALSLITMGASVKDNDSPIGYFGTGLKFAIATILRGGGKIDIFIGTKRYHIRAVATDIRGKAFDMVYVDGEKAGYTTELGRNWQPWMAYRELHSNALDEAETLIDHSEPPEPKAGYTQIRVWDENIQREYYNRGSTFIQSKPLYATSRMEVHPGSTHDLYYRGVKVGQLNKPSIFTYNLLQGVKLNEDRTAESLGAVRGIVEDVVCQAIKDEGIVAKVIRAHKGLFEHDFVYTTHEALKTKGFLACIDALVHDKTADMKALPTHVISFLEKRKSRMIEESHAIPLTAEMTDLLDTAIFTIRAMGVPVDEFPVFVVETLGAGVMGQAKNGKAFLARAAFQNGQKYLTATLLEEWFHLTTGMADHTREMQDWLFNELLSMHERKTNQMRSAA